MQTKNERWIKESLISLKKLMNEPSGTVLDSFLFDDQFTNIICELPVKFPEIYEEEFKKIRASRLKILGYRWIPKDKTWIFKNNKITLHRYQSHV